MKPFSPEEGGEKAGPPATAPAAPAEASGASSETAAAALVAAPEPAMSLAEAVAALDKMSSRVQARVITLREVTLDGEVTRELKTREQLESITRGFYRRESLRRQVFEAQELYKALGLMSEEQDLEEILLGIQLQQVVALFDDQSEKVYVISDATNIGAVEEIGISAAYVSGIQQQLFDTATLSSRARATDNDEFRGVSALIKGDVLQILEGYVSTYFDQAQYEELTKPIPGNKLLAAPDVVQKAQRFGNREGKNFVVQLYEHENKGREGVNEAYNSPPISTEQVIHPEKYFSGEEPQRTVTPNLAAKLGKGWEQVSANTMGEFLLRTYLEQHLDDAPAAEAAAGWGGDRYSLLTGPEAERLLIIQIKWDSLEDSGEFFDAYQIFGGIKTQGGGGTSEKVGDSGRKWVTPDETVFLGQIGPTILLIIGDDEDLVSRGLVLLFDALAEQTP